VTGNLNVIHGLHTCPKMWPSKCKPNSCLSPNSRRQLQCLP
jgi:hypothetical protein